MISDVKLLLFEAKLFEFSNHSNYLNSSNVWLIWTRFNSVFRVLLMPVARLEIHRSLVIEKRDKF